MKIIVKDFHKEKKFDGVAYLLDIVTLQKVFTIMLSNGGYFQKIPFKGVKLGKEVKRGMSGCVDYSSGVRKTMSGKLKFPKVFYVEEKRNESDEYESAEYDPFEIKYQMDIDSKINFVKLLEKNIKDIFILIEDKTREDLDSDFYYIHYGDMGAYFKYLPLILRYRKNDLMSLELGANLFWNGCSFNAEFSFGELNINVPKANPDSKVWGRGYAETKIGKTIIYYTEYFKRKIAYKTTKYKNIIVGFEQYRETIHSPAKLKIDHGLWDLELFFWRLGDIVAFPVEELKKYTIKNKNTIEFLMERRKKVTKRHFQKIKIIFGNLIEENGYLYLESKNEPIVLYHSEHGLLELEPKRYILLEPNYIEKGHD